MTASFRCGWLVVALLAPLAAAPPPLGEALGQWPRQPVIGVPPLVGAAPSIDGHVNYQEWVNAAHVIGFTDLDTGTAAVYPVHLYLTYDQEALYLAWVVYRPPLQPTPKATFEAGPHEHIWWKDDNVEVVLEPGRDAGYGYAFAGNSIGGFSDLRYPLKGSGSDGSWSGQWLYRATRAGLDNWHAELRVPVAQFANAAPLQPGSAWNLGVMNQPITPRKAMIDWTMLWGFGSPGYASPNKATLAFLGPNSPVVRASELGRLRPTAKDTEAGVQPAGLRIIVNNPGSQAQALRWQAAIYRYPGKREPGMLAFYELWDRLLSVQASGQPLRDPKDPTQAFRTAADLLAELGQRYQPVAEADYVVKMEAGKPGYFPLQTPLERGEHLVVWRITDTSTGQTVAAQAVPFSILPSLDLQLRPYFLTHRKLRVEADVREVAQRGDQVTAALAINGEVVAEATVGVDPAIGSAVSYLDTTRWPEGQEGRVIARLLGADGQERERNEATLTRPPTPDWFGRNLGRSAVVPPGFEPVRKLDERTVALWQRQYRFGEQALPTSIISRGTELLARPMRLHLPGLPTGTLRALEADQRDARFESTAGDALRLTTQSAVHYDGCLRVDLTLTPRQPTPLESLVLEIPLVERYATLFTHNSTGTDFGTSVADGLGGALGNWFARYPNGRMPFTFGFFLGSYDRGLQWFCESDRGWCNRVEQQKIELRRGPGEVALRIHFIDRPVTLSEPLRLNFGLMVTPVRDATPGRKLLPVAFGGPDELRRFGLPALEDWFGLAARRGATVVSSYMNDPDHFGQPRLYHQPDRELMKSVAEAAHRQGLKYRPYSGWGVHTNIPEFQTFGLEMLKEPLRNAGWGSYWHNPASTFADWWLDGVRQLVTEQGFDGIYLDGTFYPELTANELDGFAWSDAQGRRHGIYPCWAIRDFSERLYVLLHHELRPDGMVDLHDGREPLHFVTGFADTSTSGEYHLSRGKTILEVFSPEEFAAYYMTHLHGSARRFIWWNWMKLPISFNEMQAMALLHDTPLPLGGGMIKLYGTEVGYGVPSQPWSRLRLLRNAFAESEFLPYWEQTAVKLSPAGAMASGWLDRRGGRLMVVVSNLHTTPWKGELRLDAAGCGIAPETIWADAMFDQPLGRKAAEALPLAIEPQRYRLLYLNARLPLEEPAKRDGTEAALSVP
ncbi:MAG: hypothetical protein HUU35_00900 [Armatimonadetes bacterium]|nr:hypothetical protein [Armatimonadota bacterium]